MPQLNPTSTNDLPINELLVKEAKTRERTAVWSFLTDETHAKQNTTSTCKHCSKVVPHYRCLKRAINHLNNKCPGFTTLMKSQDEKDYPSWYKEGNIKRKATAAANADSKEQIHKGRRPVCSWALLTTESNPTKEIRSTCRHCARVVSHHKRISKARSHLKRCKPFVEALNNIDSSLHPTWYVPSSWGKKSKEVVKVEECKQSHVMLPQEVASCMEMLDTSTEDIPVDSSQGPQTPTEIVSLEMHMRTDCSAIGRSHQGFQSLATAPSQSQHLSFAHIARSAQLQNAAKHRGKIQAGSCFQVPNTTKTELHYSNESICPTTDLFVDPNNLEGDFNFIVGEEDWKALELEASAILLGR
jgi:hypothetical protein